MFRKNVYKGRAELKRKSLIEEKNNGLKEKPLKEWFDSKEEYFYETATKRKNLY